MNSRVAIFSKKGTKFDTSGKVLYGPVVTNIVFKGFGGNCEARQSGDAVVRYDQLADRWLFVLPLFSRGPVRPDQVEAGRAGEPLERERDRPRESTGRGDDVVRAAASPATAASAGRRAGPAARTRRRSRTGPARPARRPARPVLDVLRRQHERPIRSARTIATSSCARSFPTIPRPAIWPDGYYVPSSTSDNRISETVATQKHACVADRAKMLKGEPATEQCLIVENVNFLNNADIDGKALPPPGAPNIMMAGGGRQLDGNVQDSVIIAWQFHVDWQHPENTKLSEATRIPVAPYHYLCNGQLTNCVPQPGTDRRLDAQGDKMMQRLVYRRVGNRESIVASHSVEHRSGGGGVRWYEFRIDGNRNVTLYQQGTYAPDGNYRWLPSAGMDKDGNIGDRLLLRRPRHLPGPALRRAARQRFERPADDEGERARRGRERADEHAALGRLHDARDGSVRRLHVLVRRRLHQERRAELLVEDRILQNLQITTVPG